MACGTRGTLCDDAQCVTMEVIELTTRRFGRSSRESDVSDVSYRRDFGEYNNNIHNKDSMREQTTDNSKSMSADPKAVYHQHRK